MFHCNVKHIFVSISEILSHYVAERDQSAEPHQEVSVVVGRIQPDSSDADLSGRIPTGFEQLRSNGFVDRRLPTWYNNNNNNNNNKNARKLWDRDKRDALIA